MPESTVDSLGLTHNKDNSSESSEVPEVTKVDKTKTTMLMRQVHLVLYRPLFIVVKPGLTGQKHSHYIPAQINPYLLLHCQAGPSLARFNQFTLQLVLSHLMLYPS